MPSPIPARPSRSTPTLAAKLVASKAARRVKVEARDPVAPKSGPKTKRATAPVKAEAVEVAAEADDSETLI